MHPLEYLHEQRVMGRRAMILARHLATVIEPQAKILDVGCGSGEVAARLAELRPDVTVEGIDVLRQPATRIRVTVFDGKTIPFGSASFGAVMLVDTLHHTPNSLELLREPKRVAAAALVIKDHTRQGWLAGPTLRLMDWVGNARHGVALPYNYWTRRQWDEAFRVLDVRVAVWRQRLQLYPMPWSLLFDRSLHFLARLEVQSPSAGSKTPSLGG